jgi:hypothetical protein
MWHNPEDSHLKIHIMKRNFGRQMLSDTNVTTHICYHSKRYSEKWYRNLGRLFKKRDMEGKDHQQNTDTSTKLSMPSNISDTGDQ